MSASPRLDPRALRASAFDALPMPSAVLDGPGRGRQVVIHRRRINSPRTARAA